MRKNLLYADKDTNRFWEIEVTGSAFTVVQGMEGTVGQTSVSRFANGDECLQQAKLLIAGQQEIGFIEQAAGYIKRFAPPHDMKKALTKQRVVVTHHGIFTLEALEDVRLISVVIRHESRDADKNGMFCTTAYALTSDEETQKMLVWLPVAEFYGTWDMARQQLYIFPRLTWQDLENHLPVYLQYQPEKDAFINAEAYDKLWDCLDFIPDNLATQASKIAALPDAEKIAEAQQFLRQYELRLLRHPVCVQLEGAYRALVKLYCSVAVTFKKQERYTDVVAWLERALLIVNQWRHYRTALFSDLLMDLALCSFRLCDFEASLRYVALYQSYCPAAQQACDEIRVSIYRVRQLYQEAMDSRQNAIMERSAECYEEAIRVTRQAIALAPDDPQLYFNLACFYSLSFKTKEALYYLEAALKKGYKTPTDILTEEDLENIRSTKEFEEMSLKFRV